MLETISVFDNLEIDNTNHRVASRRALALAHTRVEAGLGRFLRAAQSEDEFFERLGLVIEDFDGYVTTASNEVGHDHPEHIAAALKDHYRLAAQPVQFAQTPAEEQEEDEEKEEEKKVATLTPKQTKKVLKRMAKAGRTWGTVKVAEEHPAMHPPQMDPNNMGGHLDALSEQGYRQNPMVYCKNCGEGSWLNPDGSCADCGQDPNTQGTPGGQEMGNPFPQDHPSPGHMMGGEAGSYMAGKQGSPLPGKQGGAQDPGLQDDDSSRLVSCPECGGSGKTAGATSCGKCKGKGKVPNFGDSMLDALTSKTACNECGCNNPDCKCPPGCDGKCCGKTSRTAADGNTDLDGPEPKMDKRLWTPKSVGEPDTEDGSRHPTDHKDVTEVIGPARNDKEIPEIHGQGTHFETEKLPTQTGDTPFATGGEDFGPHTDTWGSGDQADPVTRASQSSTNTNPLLDLVTSEWPSEQAVKAAFLKS